LAQTAEVKSQIVSQFGHHETDTGSPEVQVALLTSRINELTEHFKQHTNDHHGRRGLMKMVGRRRRMLEYLKRRNLERYRQTIERLGLRK
jgi:small subunit ribosomal protein S15